MRKLDACAPVVSPLGDPVATPRQMGDVTATGTRGARHAAVRATLCLLALILIPATARGGGQRYPARRDHGRDPGRVDRCCRPIRRVPASSWSRRTARDGWWSM